MIWSAISAQCVMCYRTAAAQGAARGRVFDSGIVLLLIPPVLILAGLLWLAVRSQSRAAEKAPYPNEQPYADPNLR